jgi:hypothetical protein
VFVALTDGSIVTTENSQGRFYYYSPEGDLRRIIEVPLTSRRIDEREHAEILRDFYTLPGAAGLEAPAISTHYPLFVNMHALGDSVFAIEHARRGHPAEDPPLGENQRRWRVFTTTGRFVGALSLPEDFATRLGQADGFWGVRIDSTRFPHLEKRAIRVTAP